MATYDLNEVLSAGTENKGTYSLDEVMGTPAPKVQTLTRMDKIGKGARDPVDAGAQLLTNMLPSGVVNAGNRLNNYIADKTGLVGRLPEGGVNQQINDQEANYQAQRAAQGESGLDGYRLAGNIVSPANLAMASKLPQAATLAGRVGVGALGGGVLTAASQPVVGESGNFWQEKGKQAAVGAVTGGALPLVTGGLARLISPKASVNPNVQLLREEGVNPTIGQTLGGIPNRIEEKLQSVPIMGDMISNARGQANQQFEAAAYNRALKPLGQELPKGLSGRDALVHTESTLKNAYDDVLTRIGAIQPDATFTKKVADLEAMVNKQVMPRAEKAKFASALSDVKQSMDANGVITSDAYKALESSLGTDARKLGSSTNIYEGKLAPAVKQLQAELKDMLQRQSGPLSDELKSVNTGYANFKRVQNAASKVGAEDGSFNPAQFQNAVRTMDKSKDKAAFARGSALGQDLGDAGKTVLGSKVPNSGTAERLLYGGGAVASGMLNPAIPVSLAAGGALYTQPGQKLLNALIASRPKSAVPMAELLRKSGNYVIPAAGAAGLGLLN